MIIVTVMLVPWTILLGFTLPSHYVVAHWTAAWIGLDVAEILLFGATSYLALRRRPAASPLACMTATLLCCDAFFDITTASTGADLAASVIAAVCIELPLAALLFTIGLRYFRRLVRAAGGGVPAGEAGPANPVGPASVTTGRLGAAPVVPAAAAPAGAPSVRDNAALWITTVLPSRAETRDGPISSR
jgi:hypothetical protein